MVEIRAIFKQLSISDKSTIQLVLDPEDMHALPSLAKLTGRRVNVGIEDEQLVLVTEDGEVVG